MQKGGEGGGARVARLLLHAKPVLSITRGQEEDRAADVYGLFWFSRRMEDGGAACEVEEATVPRSA